MAIYTLTFTKPTGLEAPNDTLTIEMEGNSYNEQYLETYYTGKGFTLVSNVESPRVVDDINANLLDGSESTAFAVASHNHDSSYAAKATAPVIYGGVTAPDFTPTKVGDIFLDTVGLKVYVSTGTSSSTDWTVLN